MDGLNKEFIGCIVAGVALGVSLAHFSRPSWCNAKPKGKPTLKYFDGRGLAEVARTMFAVAGVEYEDMRYKLVIADGDGPVMSRISKKEMDADAAAGKFVANMGRLPVLELPCGKSIGGSKAIYRYIANNYGLSGSNAYETAKIDSICEMITDITGDFDKANDKDKWFNTSAADGSAQGNRSFAYYLEQLEKVVGKNGFAVGNSFSMADAVIYNKFAETCTTQGLFGSPKSEPMQNKAAVDRCIAQSAPSVAKIISNFASNPGMQAHLKNRGHQMF
jgi:glutathione S-transferase